ncbi:hypothetical protein PSHT_06393 [Puccinia striiformis]|uniref:DNA helicase n=1 Tax=Puccinia striiformis TaxID=27350 RepID=A0A2S4W6S6_9BASI|nr:hypothetical protein PSHT_06393 [Puccinia striiformis]
MPPFGFDRGSINVVPVLGSATDHDAGSSHGSGLIGGVPPYKKIQNLRKFILDFRLANRLFTGIYVSHFVPASPCFSYIIYNKLTFQNSVLVVCRDRLRTNLLAKVYAIEIELQHLIVYDEELAHSISNSPGEILPLFEIAVRKVAEAMVSPLSKSGELYDDEDPEMELAASGAHDLPDFQVTLRSEARLMQFRDLLVSSQHSKLVRMPGIVISASTLSSRATMLHLTCKSCRHVRRIAVPGRFYGLHSTTGLFSDSDQGEKKECPLDPYTIVHEKSRFPDNRHWDLLYLQRIREESGGDRLETTYLRVVGLEVDGDGHGSNGGHQQFSAEEEDEFNGMANSQGFYQRFAESIAPSIYGNEDIKKAVVCLLMGGSKKILPDGMRLRGDINVLLLGDPGTAKSQLLIQRDPQSREFYLEGGAMVLADGGVPVSRPSLTRELAFAAANPVFGRYDDMKSPEYRFSNHYLIRFDMIFIVKDEHDELRDRVTIARHVMDLHMNRAVEAQQTGEIDLQKMKRFITYARSRCSPRLSTEAAEELSSHFVSQLEAIIRISESIAKLSLSRRVEIYHVEESIRLFKYSTMDAVQAGNIEGITKGELQEEISKGYSAHALERCLYILERREVIRFWQKRTVQRVGA